MLMDILMEALMSMDDDTLDSVLESCDAEELEIIDSAMEMITSDGKHRQTKPGSINHARKANELMAHINPRLSQLARTKDAEYQDGTYKDGSPRMNMNTRYDSSGKSARQYEKYSKIRDALSPENYSGAARIIRQEGEGFTPEATNIIRSRRNGDPVDTMPRYTAKKK